MRLVPLTLATLAAVCLPNLAYAQSADSTNSEATEATTELTIPLTEENDNCRYFTTWADAQYFFTTRDPTNIYELDTDGDGIACEDLP